MDNSKQVETVKKALELEMYIANTSRDLSNLLSMQFHPVPNPPTRNVIQKTEPPINPLTKFNWKVAFIPAICLLILFPAPIVWLVIYYFVIYKKKRDEEIVQIKNSVDYKNQCIAAEKEFVRMQEEAEVLYKIQSEEYETIILPKYQKDLEDWTTGHNEKINETESNLRSAKDTLKQLYESTKIVPLQYREIDPLQFIYSTISTSDYDVKYAIEMYERSEQRKLDEARLYQQQQANQLADEQNDLLNQQNDIAAKAKRDANIASAIGAVQRHNTNKALKNMFKK